MKEIAKLKAKEEKSVDLWTAVEGESQRSHRHCIIVISGKRVYIKSRIPELLHHRHCCIICTLDPPSAWKGKDEKSISRIPLWVDRKISSGRTIEMAAWVICKTSMQAERRPFVDR